MEMDRYEDRMFGTSGGTILVRNYPDLPAGGPWLVTWLPDDTHSPSYPGFTLSSTDGVVPAGPTAEQVMEWAKQQPFVTGNPQPPVEIKTFNVDTSQWATVQREAFEQGFRVGFTQEPDGSFSWGVFSLDGETLQSGVADTWDDARLALIENMHPKSGEA